MEVGNTIDGAIIAGMLLYRAAKDLDPASELYN